MPTLTESNVRHLLRRTEFVDRQARVDELLGLGSIEAAVANVLAVGSNPPSVVFAYSADEDWLNGQQMGHFWFDRMAKDSARPMQEKMALFWHGHLVSAIGKVGDAEPMREQIDLYRSAGLDNFRDLVITMSIQVAMLRYLDNNQNHAESPNQNFARELMELFLLGVGNYSEADVEAATAAWTGHSDDRNTGLYRWRDDAEKQPWEPVYHDASVKQFLGRTINQGGDPRLHGAETVDVILGNGIVPPDADQAQNRGRPTQQVAAEFLSRKLWVDFADQAPPADVIAAMSSAFIAGGFDINPWVTAMLTSDAFYSDDVKHGLVRSPIDWVVALLHATGFPSEEATPMWLMGTMGQRPFSPPNVSGWKINGYYVNASAMEGRARVAQGFAWTAARNFWKEDGSGYLQLRNGRVTLAELIERDGDRNPVMSDVEVLDKMLDLMELTVAPSTRQHLLDHLAAGSVWDRGSVLLLVFLTPELHIA